MTGLPASRERRACALSLCLPALLPCAATGSFGLTCRTATGTTEPSVRCVLYIHLFPTTSRTQEGRFSAERDWSSCNRRWSWAARAGALGGARCETNVRPRAQYAPEPSVPEPSVSYLAARSSRSSSRWPRLIAPSLPAFSVNRESLSSRRTRIPPLLSLHATSPQNYGRRRSTTCGGEFPAGSSPDCRLPDLL